MPSSSVFIAYAISLLPIFLSFFVFKAIFKNYRKGDFFTAINAGYYRYLGWLFFLEALLAKPLSDGLMMVTVTLSNPSGHRHLALSWGIPSLEVLFCGTLLIVISWVMLEASKLQDEQKLTV
jgi:hypothetical protein